MVYHSFKSKTSLRTTAVGMLLAVLIILLSFFYFLTVDTFSFIVGSVLLLFFICISISLWKNAVDTFVTIDDKKLRWRTIFHEVTEGAVSLLDIVNVELRSDPFQHDGDIPNLYITTNSNTSYLIPTPDDRPHKLYSALKTVCINAEFNETTGKITSLHAV